jgi:hypothetical protein
MYRSPTQPGKHCFCVDAHRDDWKSYVVHSGELLTVFLELQKQTRAAESTSQAHELDA